MVIISVDLKILIYDSTAGLPSAYMAPEIKAAPAITPRSFTGTQATYLISEAPVRSFLSQQNLSQDEIQRFVDHILLWLCGN